MVISGGTVISSLMSERVINRFGTGRVTFVSVFATALSLLGFSLAPGFVWIILCAIPLGLGAGAIDAGLNNYVALHYKPHHMSWLHCFWGVGAFTGPFIMSAFLRDGGNWRGSYLTVAVIQFGIVLLLLFTLPLWKKNDAPAGVGADDGESIPAPSGSPLRLRGAVPALLAFLCYSTVEMSLNAWCASYLVENRGLEAATAAQWVAIFFVGITVGRLVTGFLTMRLNNRQLIRLGQGIILVGALLFLVPFSPYFALAGIVLIGLGCAPIFPCMLHETPYRFGKEWSQKIMGLQMATGYTASTLVPPLIGLIASQAGFGFMPVFLLAAGALMLLVSERVNRVVAYRDTL